MKLLIVLFARLKSTKSILLEPYFKFSLQLPREYLSKAIYDLEAMKGTFTLPEDHDEIITITGRAPVSKCRIIKMKSLIIPKEKVV